MKRILSLILALLLCCGFVVSCEKEETPSESESSSSNTLPKEVITNEGYVAYRYNEVDESLEYNFESHKSSGEIEYKGVAFTYFKSFDDFRKDFLNVNSADASKIFDISKVDFEEYIIYALLLKDSQSKPLKYGNISDTALTGSSANFMLYAERQIIKSTTDENGALSSKLDIVLIPKSEFKTDKIVENIDLTIYSHVFLSNEEAYIFSKTVPQYVSCSVCFEKRTNAHVLPDSLSGIYESYNCKASEEDLRFFFESATAIDNYKDLQTFFNWWIDEGETNPFDEATFQDNLIIAVLRLGNIVQTEGYYYTEFQKTENGYRIKLNIPLNGDDSQLYYADIPLSPSFDFVVIPRSLCDSSFVETNIIVSGRVLYYRGPIA